MVSQKVITEWLNQKTEGEILVIFGLIPSVTHPSQVLLQQLMSHQHRFAFPQADVLLTVLMSLGTKSECI